MHLSKRAALRSYSATPDMDVRARRIVGVELGAGGDRADLSPARPLTRRSEPLVSTGDRILIDVT